MIKNKEISFPFIGLALFSMFFGAGNLIFPLFVGQMAQDQCVLASLGFLVTAVSVPFLGVIAMLAFRGNYTYFFQRLGNRTGSLMIAALLTVWIPLGSAPRCIILAYSSLIAYFPFMPLWFFSLVYCGIIYFVIGKKGRMLDLLGYVLTPLLLICLAMIIFNGVSVEKVFAQPTTDGWDHFFLGLTEGYNTMDLIASFFFSASVIEILQSTSSDKSSPIRTTFKACVVGMALLGVVYISLIALAGTHYEMLQHIPKDQALAHISKHVLGPQLGAFAVGAVFLACFTTSIALVAVYADYLSKTLFKRRPADLRAKTVTLVVTFVISLTGLAGITMITSPLLEIFYPFLIIMIIVTLLLGWIKKIPFKSEELEILEETR